LENANECSVPTHNDIAVPETILKKQKASQKATDSKAADLQKKREVR
jgi:large subunit ribosomal protein L7e